MEMFIYFLISLALNVVAYMLAPKPSQPKPSVEDLKNPTAEAGRPLPVPFGSIKVRSPNYIWYGSKMVAQRKSDRPPAGFFQMPGMPEPIEDPRYVEN